MIQFFRKCKITLKSHIFAVRNFRGNKFSREFIFANDILKNSTGTYFREFREWLFFWKFREIFRGNLFSRISRGYNIVVFYGEKFFSGHFAGTNFRKFREWHVFFNFAGRKFYDFSFFRANKFPRKCFPTKISHRKNMRF